MRLHDRLVNFTLSLILALVPCVEAQVVRIPGVGGTAPGGVAAITHIADAVEASTATGTVTSGTLNVLAGDKIIAMCRSGGSANTITLTSTGGDSPSYTTHETDGNIGNTQIAYIGNAAANASDAFTCNFTGSPGGRDIIVMQFRGGLTSSILDTQLQGAIGSTTATLTTGSFSTATGNEVVVLCGANDSNNNVYAAGAIGGTTATLSTASPIQDLGCEYLIETAPQTSITATMTTTTTTPHWNWQMGAFK